MMSAERGYAMAALLVGLSVMAIMLSVALPVWRTVAQREREAELIFRGEQYAHAIELYSRRNGGYPATLDVLEKGRFIRKLYKDPIAGNADFQPVFVGQMIGGQPAAPRQPGGAGTPGITGGQAGQTPAPGPGAQGGRGGQPAGQTLGQPLGQTQGRGAAAGGGPIIGVVSRSTAESLSLYNGRGRYNEWAFVATATSQQAGAPTGPPGTAPGGRGGPPGTAPGGRGGPPGPQRGGGRGISPGGAPPAPGRFGAPRGNPFGMPNGPAPGGGAPQPR
jgi:type II secretory pathway pseudopilin PulG